MRIQPQYVNVNMQKKRNKYIRKMTYTQNTNNDEDEATQN